MKLAVQRSGRFARAGLVAFGVTVTTAAVAMAGRAPISGSRVSAASASAPLTALVLLFIAAGILVLASLVVLMWQQRRRRTDDERELLEEPRRLRWFWKLLALLVALALPAALIVAAIFGLHKRGSAAPPPFVGPVGRAPSAPPVHRGAGNTFVLPGWLPWTALAIVLVAVVALGIWLVLRLRAEREPPDQRDVRVATQAAVEAAIGALESPADPRSAVIAAYAAMERTLAEHGVARPRSEAPREYLARVLTHVSESEPEARRLTSLFEEARFSPHPIPERVRELALATLDSLRRHFDRVAA